MSLRYMVSNDILKEELDKIKQCECCNLNSSCFLYILLNGKNIILSHVCTDCRVSLIGIIDDVDDYEFLTKNKI